MVYYCLMKHSGDIAERKPPFGVFLSTTVLIFFLSLSSADSIGLVPSYIDGTKPASSPNVDLSSFPELGSETNDSAVAQGVAPERIIIPAIDLDLAVQNPGTRDIAALDTLLEKGPARYVDSAELGVVGNMIIFAHSSNLPIVHNKMYQAFNKIPELKAGDSITVTGEGKAYLYTVTSMIKADATDTSIDMSPSKGTRLTLVTCDTLTGKSARYVLEAELVGSYEL